MDLQARWLAVALVAGAAFVLGTAIAADPPGGLSEDGTVIFYRADPGELPGRVAERFGIAPADVPAFLAANGIRDATKVGTGHVYRIRNPLAARARDAEARADGLAKELAAAHGERAVLDARANAESTRADDLARRAARLEGIARVWPWLQAIAIVLVLAVAGAGMVAYRSATRLGALARYAKELADQLDERRRIALAERQANARRVLDLEESVRTLERELASHRALRPRPTGTH